MLKVANSSSDAPAVSVGEASRITHERHALFACYDFNIGGHSTHTLNFARALRRRGWRVGALVLEPFGDLYSDFTRGLDYIAIARRGLETRIRYLHRLLNKIRSLQPGVIINNGVQPVQALLPFLPSRIKSVSVIHNWVESEVTLGLANGRWLDWAVAVSDNVRDFMDQRNHDRVRLATIPVGVVLPELARVKETAANPLRLIYVGRLEGQKNLPGLLQVLQHLEKASIPFSMTIVGAGKELQSIQAQAAALRLGDKVRFLGAQPQGQVARLLDAHDFLIMTSHYEGTPHAMLEAMAHGLVVVASRLSGATDRIVAHQVDGFLCDRNKPEEYVAVLRRFLEYPGDFGPISKAARETVLKRYGTNSLAIRYEDLFQNLSPERVDRTPQRLNGDLVLPPELQTNFPGLILQCKHRVADLWRRVAQGRRSIPETGYR